MKPNFIINLSNNYTYSKSTAIKLSIQATQRHNNLHIPDSTHPDQSILSINNQLFASINNYLIPIQKHELIPIGE